MVLARTKKSSRDQLQSTARRGLLRSTTAFAQRTAGAVRHVSHATTASPWSFTRELCQRPRRRRNETRIAGLVLRIVVDRHDRRRGGPLRNDQLRWREAGGAAAANRTVASNGR